MLKKILIALAVVALQGCTAERGYLSAQGWQRQQCARIPDKAEYDRCMREADMPYDSYKRQTEPAQR